MSVPSLAPMNPTGPSPRIVSLVPSWTAALWDLGLAHNLVGKTRFCIYPRGLRSSGIPSVGGTKDVDVARVLDLRPDLVVTNDEENLRPVLHELLAELGPDRLVRTFPQTPEQALGDLVHLAKRAGAKAHVLETWLAKIEAAQQDLHQELARRSTGGTHTTCDFLYLVWMNPWMAAGDKTYISALLSEGGFRNRVTTSDDPKERYPSVAPESPLHQGPHDTCFVFLSSEPFAFRPRHVQVFSSEWHWPQERITRVDGRALSWYGTGLADGYREVKRLLIHCSAGFKD